MSQSPESLYICGNILSTKDYSFFTLRCTECGNSFSQWLLFIKHLELKHGGGNDDSLRNLVKCEFSHEVFLNEDSIKNELESVEGVENVEEGFGSSEVKDESEVNESDSAESDSQDSEESIDKSARTTTRKSKKSKIEADRQLKTFYFNINEPELIKVSLAFLKVLEEYPMLWDYKHEDYRKPRARTKAIKLIKLHLRKMGYSASDSGLCRTIPRVLRDYRRANEKLALHGKIEKRLRLFLNKCKFLNELIVDDVIDSTIKDSDAELESGCDTSENLVEDPELAKILLHTSKSGYKRMLLHVPSNKLVIDLIQLWRENPPLWNAKRSEKNTVNDRRRIIESWINVFKERHNVTFTYEDLNSNLQLLRRYYNKLRTRKPMTEAATYILKACNFLPVSRKGVRIKCDHCFTFFLTENNYKAHLYTAHQIGESPYKCQECNKVFGSANHLDMHVRSVHTKQFDFPCTVCDKRFLRKCHLTFHMHIHTGEKSFICETCGKTFRRRLYLKNHETRIHLRLRNFACTMCPKAFYTKALLKDHLNAHLNIRNCKCPFCDKAFHSAHALMRHKQIHSEVKRYECKLCDAKFHQFVGLNSHMKNRHSTE